MLWVLQPACLGLAGYMEYYVQRHGNKALFAYSIMGVALGVFLLLTLLTHHKAVVEQKRNEECLQEIGEIK